MWAFPTQYLLGDGLLVAPVVEPGARDVAGLPAGGQWVDAWTGAPVASGQEHEREVPIEIIPAYVRAAAWPGLEAAFGGVRAAARRGAGRTRAGRSRQPVD